MPFDLQAFLNQPLAIRGRPIPARLVLAPLSKLGNTAFRQVVREFGRGYGLLFSEMCWARSVPCGNGHDLGGFTWRPDEDLGEVVCQIFGSDPQAMARAAAIIAGEGFFGVDLNFGCCVAAVCRKGCGAALLKTPHQAEAIVAAVRKAVEVPVCVKFRTGWEDDPKAAVELARRFEGAGADALTFHPRVAPDRRTRPPRWEHIGAVKAAVGIPVFGNGEVLHPEDAARMIRLTGCDGVALGRLALAQPWVFAAWTLGFRPSPSIFGDCAGRLLDLLVETYGETVALRRFHRFAAYYTANFTFGHALYARLCKAATPAEVKQSLADFLEAAPQTISRPNMNRFR